MLERARAAVAARKVAEAGGFTVVEPRGGPRGTTLGDCLAAATTASSQRARRARHGRRNPSAGLALFAIEKELPAASACRFACCCSGEGTEHCCTQLACSGCSAVGSAFVAGRLHGLQHDAAGCLVGAVTRDLVEAVVDSGAEESVAPPGWFAAAVSPSPMSRAGGKYRAANGSRIRNLGQQQVTFTTAEGHHCNMSFQVAEVERPLLSVAQLTSAGHRVVLGDAGGQIVHVESGRTIDLVRRGGVYLLLMNI